MRKTSLRSLRSLFLMAVRVPTSSSGLRSSDSLRKGATANFGKRALTSWAIFPPIASEDTVCCAVLPSISGSIITGLGGEAVRPGTFSAVLNKALAARSIARSNCTGSGGGAWTAGAGAAGAGGGGAAGAGAAAAGGSGLGAGVSQAATSSTAASATSLSDAWRRAKLVMSVSS